MKRYFLFLTVTISAFIMAGCQKDIALLEEDFIVSPDKAKRIAERISESIINKGSISGNNIIIDFKDTANQNEASKVKYIHIVNDKNDKPAFYIIDFEEGGFVILSADIRMGPILSISEVGSFGVNDEYPEGLNSWMNNIKESIEILRAGNYEADKNQRHAWEALLSVEQNSITTRSEIKDPFEYLTVTELKHIMNLKWNHHGDGYNDSVPHNCPNNPGGKAYAGCVPVTVGQILRHWRYPESYDWDKMPTSHATPTTAKFLVDIGKDVRVYYTCNSGSGSYMDIGYALRTFYGYNATNDTYTYEKLTKEIDSERPVILSGPANLYEGRRIEHAWICEGYMEYVIGINPKYSMDKESKSNISQPRKMLYMNWGWNEYNGWYSSGKFINGVGRFFIKEMTRNIYPKEE